MDREASSAVRSTNVEQLLTPASAAPLDPPLDPPEEPPEDPPEEPPEEPPDDDPPLELEDGEDGVLESEHATARINEPRPMSEEERRRILEA
jgi:hypothetical protein